MRSCQGFRQSTFSMVMSRPYLAGAFLLAPGLEGIEQRIDPGPGREHNLYEYSDEQLRASGIAELPRTLPDAVAAFEADPLSEGVFGRGLRRAFAQLKSGEWWEYYYQVTPWEIDRYLSGV